MAAITPSAIAAALEHDGQGGSTAEQQIITNVLLSAKLCKIFIEWQFYLQHSKPLFSKI
jgi:hypothetical protein